MGFTMKDLNQEIIKFDYEKNFKNEDFYISKSNQHILKLINIWPKWEKNLLNINGDKYSGKTHLVKIFIKKFNGIKIDSHLLNNDFLKEINSSLCEHNWLNKVDSQIFEYNQSSSILIKCKRYASENEILKTISDVCESKM